MQWYKVKKYDELHKAEMIMHGGRITITTLDKTVKTLLTITELRVEDGGVYFCKIKDIWGPGSELRVASKNQLDKQMQTYI